MINNQFATTVNLSKDTKYAQNGAAKGMENSSGNLTSDNTINKALSTGSFSQLLAQQIGEASFPVDNSTPISAAIIRTVTTTNEKLHVKTHPEQAPTTNSTNDLPNSLGAILLQLPPQLNELGVKGTTQESDTKFNADILSAGLNSKDASLTIDYGRFNQKSKSELKVKHEGPYTLGKNVSTPIMSATSIDNSTSIATTPTKLFEVTSQTISMGTYQVADGSIYKNNNGRSISMAEVDLKKEVEDPFILNKESNLPIEASQSLATTGLQPSALLTKGIPLNTVSVDTGLTIKKANQTLKDSFDPGQPNEIGALQTAGTLAETDKVKETSFNQMQISTSSNIMAFETANRKMLNSSISEQQQDSPIGTSLNPSGVPASTYLGVTHGQITTDIVQTVQPLLGNKKWSSEFSQKIVWLCTQQNQTAELHLNPPDLGPLNVTLKLSNDQLTAQFSSSHSAVRDAIENAMPKLREILADNGIMLNNATVGDQTPRNRSPDGYPNQESRSTPPRVTIDNLEKTEKSSTTTAPITQSRRQRGILDTFA